MVHAKKYLNSLSPQGTAPLHDAVTGNHTIICSLLAAEVLTLVSITNLLIEPHMVACGYITNTDSEM